MRRSQLALAAVLAAAALSASASGCGGGDSGPTGLAASFCDNLEGHNMRCGGGECAEALLDECGALTDTLSGSYLETATGCLRGDSSLSGCLLASVGAVSPSTEAHTGLASGYCASCGSGAECEESFYDEESETGPVATLARPFHPDVVGAIGEQCADACGDAMAGCVEQVLVDEGVPETTAGCFVGALGGESFGGGEGECVTPDAGGMDAGADDGGGTDAGPSRDSGSGEDAGAEDAGSDDAGPADSGMSDGGTPGECDPACPDGQMCVDGECVADPACPDEGEPNDSQSEAVDLGSISDGDSFPAGTESASLPDELDQDWYTYDVSDDFPGVMGPRATIDNGELRVCAFWQCPDDDGDVSCDAGDPESMGGLSGCCSAGDGNVKLNPDCPGIDDSGTVLLRVIAKGDLTECESYMLEWGDD